MTPSLILSKDSTAGEDDYHGHHEDDHHGHAYLRESVKTFVAESVRPSVKGVGGIPPKSAIFGTKISSAMRGTPLIRKENF